MTLNALSAGELAAGVRAGTFTARDVAEVCCAQIARVEPRVNAWAHFVPGEFMAQADAIDLRRDRGEALGALAGVPVGVKDIFNTRDMPTQMGSAIWRGFTPGNDARVVHSLRMADAVIPGKTVTAEFAVHTPGPTRNPYAPEFMAGTSSTGSAVAVACRMVPAALGTQTAGSTIRPASYNGVYGFKPSFGLVPRTAMLKTTDSLDTVGWFARAVDDLALIFEAIRVHGPDYPISHAALADPENRGVRGRRWRVALVQGPKWGDAEPYARESLAAFAETVRTIPGVDVAPRALPASLAEAHATHATIYDRTLAYYFKEEFKKHTLVSHVMYEIIERGNGISLDAYKAALGRQAAIALDMQAFFAETDICLDLATGGEALRGTQTPDRPDNCLIWTLCGLPALALPVFTGPLGLPFGAQFVGRRFADYKVLAFARLLAAHGAAPRQAPGAPL